MEYTKKWKNKDAMKYANHLITVLGHPDESSESMVFWRDEKARKAGFLKIAVIDESIPHDFPMKHHDFCYSAKRMVMTPKIAGVLAAVSGSIIIDGLKKTVTARCGALIKNAVTLGFVEDMKKGKISTNVVAAKKEYARRIKENITPSWFRDVASDKKVM